MDTDNIPERCSEPFTKLQNAVESTNAVEASRALDELSTALHELHPDWDSSTDRHRPDVAFNNKDRADEFLRAIADALSRHDGGGHWLLVTHSELHGFRTVVLDYTDEQLGYEPVEPDD